MQFDTQAHWSHSHSGFFLRFRFGDRKEILREHFEEFERPFSIDVISGHYILRDRWRNLRDRFGPTKHLKKTLLALIMDLSNLWKHCYRHTHASFHKVQMNVAYRYQHVTVSLHYLPRCVRSTVSCNKTPATVKAVAHMAICGAAAVALAPGRAGAQCTHAAGAAGGSTAG